MKKPKRARRRKPDTAKVDLKPPRILRRTGCPPRGGIRRVCGEVPGRSRGSHPMTNRSAQGGARSSRHYGGEGVLIHPPHQGVCGRHGTEDQYVTPGGLGGSAGGAAATDPISVSEMGRDARRGVGRLNSTSSAVKAVWPLVRQSSGLGKSAGEDGWERKESEKSKGVEDGKFLE